ncbi:MAG: AMP-binding protein [Pseudomonadota bacterium]
MADLLARFAAVVEENPDRIAIVDGKGKETSFRALDRRVRQLAGQWRNKGIGRGDRVLLAMPVAADLYASLAALWSLGATVVLPEPAMGLKGLRHAARTVEPKAFCASGWYIALRFLLQELRKLTLLRPGSDHLDRPEHGVIPASSDTALISFTSGTTGAPKAIPRSHGFLTAQYKAVAPLLASDRKERDLVAFPVFTLINLAEGRTSVLPNWKMSRIDRLSPQAMGAWLSQQNVTRMLIPPSLCETFLKVPTPSGLHTVFTGGGPVFPDLITKLHGKTGLNLICVYGSTEAEPIAHLNTNDITPEEFEEMAQGGGLLVGPPVPQTRTRIVDGEILVAGDHVNKSYLDPRQNAANKVQENGVTWHRTGDAGTFDGAGRLWLLGRVGTEIATATGPLFPFAVETAARQWPGVRQAALMGTDGAPMLVIEGDQVNQSSWERSARGMGIEKVHWIRRMPMDQRHHSKIDRGKLTGLLGSAG